MTVAIVIPTVPGREVDLERCVKAYDQTAPDANVYIERGHPSCGEAWIAGADKAEGDGFDYLHLTADDLEPHEGWLDAATEAVDGGSIPAPVVLRPDGSLESAGLNGFALNGTVGEDWQSVEGTTVPFLTRGMWEAMVVVPGFVSTMAATHFCTDLMVSEAGRRFCGAETAIRTEMVFTHYTAMPGRNYGRADSDTRKYNQWVATL